METSIIVYLGGEYTNKSIGEHNKNFDLYEENSFVNCGFFRQKNNSISYL